MAISLFEVVAFIQTLHVTLWSVMPSFSQTSSTSFARTLTSCGCDVSLSAKQEVLVFSIFRPENRIDAPHNV